MGSKMIEVGNISDQVYERLLEQIVTGQRPAGSPMREAELAAELGVSRTPVREALSRLAGGGLVRVRRNSWAEVRRLTAEEVAHLYQVRAVLEGLAAELSAGRLSSEDIEHLRQLEADSCRPRSRTPKLERLHRFDAELHRLCAERSGNPVLATEIRKYRDIVQLIRVQVGDRAADTALSEHSAILTALIAGESAKARRLMVAHVHAVAATAAESFAADAGG